MLETKYTLTKNNLDSSSNLPELIFKENVCFNDICHVTNQRSGKRQHSLNYCHVTMIDLILLEISLENKSPVSILTKSLPFQPHIL